MAANVDLTGFHKGEEVTITVLAKNRDGTPLQDAASQSLILVIASSESGSPELEFTTDDTQITLEDVATANFSIVLDPADVTVLNEGTTYYYNIWTEDSDGDRLLQARGLIRLRSSIEPS